MSTDNTAPYIVIGSGIAGAATAYYLAKNECPVVVIDRKEAGQATDAAAGILCPWLSQRRNKAWYHLAKEGVKFYPQLIDDLAEDGQMDTGYAKVGAISLHKDGEKLQAMKERAVKRRENAPEIGEITLLDEEQTKALFPLLADGFGSVHVSGAARVDGRKLRESLIRAAKSLGAVFLEGSAQLLFKGNSIYGVEVEGKEINAVKVIAAAGAWMGELFKPLGVDFHVQPQRAQIMHIQMQNVKTDLWPLVMPPNNQYMLTFGNGRVVIGSTHEDEAGYDYRVTAGGMHEILTKAMETAPGIASATVVETRVGFRPVAPGFLPIIGELTGWDGLLLINGLGASGLTMGPYIGSQVARLSQGKKIDLDLNNYDVAQAL
ncbi:FAD-dependent oxidoreductase [Virgibacillus sp. YIM 98842]|uniref:NAD(P)/FAD-dependent oxidoreductase n=1 Tax=Virgibacillus sp. YIM 98842 TaxID=2663533 RepID=UPI0013DC8B98|nr:FAD-dependent oxidoreductase [Virgibacillus sp. YIM 98842]